VSSRRRLAREGVKEKVNKKKTEKKISGDHRGNPKGKETLSLHIIRKDFLPRVISSKGKVRQLLWRTCWSQKGAMV